MTSHARGSRLARSRVGGLYSETSRVGDLYFATSHAGGLYFATSRARGLYFATSNARDSYFATSHARRSRCVTSRARGSWRGRVTSSKEDKTSPCIGNAGPRPTPPPASDTPPFRIGTRLRRGSNLDLAEFPVAPRVPPALRVLDWIRWRRSWNADSAAAGDGAADAAAADDVAGAPADAPSDAAAGAGALADAAADDVAAPAVAVKWSIQQRNNRWRHAANAKKMVESANRSIRWAA